MAKALLGHMGGVDHHALAENRRLTHRVRDLEAEVMRLREENEALVGALDHDALIRLAAPTEPALA